MFARETVQLRDIADLIARDPTFSARILQCANSVEFGLHSEITNIRQALTMLGLDRARSLTVSLATAAYMRPALAASELQRCWKHTVACAILSQEIANECGTQKEHAYTGGILHDIGRLGLLVAYPREYEAVVRHAAVHSLDLLDYEREHFGVDHCEAGRFLAHRWNLPEIFRLIAGRHHDRLDNPELDLLTIVNYACRASDALGFEVTTPLRPLSLEDTLSGLPPSIVQRLIDRQDDIVAKVEQHVAFFDLGAQPVAPNVDPTETVRHELEDQDFDADISPVTIPSPTSSKLRAWLAWLAFAGLIALLFFAALRGS